MLEDEGYLSGRMLSEMVFNCGRWMVDGAQQEALNFYVIGSHGFTYLH